MKNLEKFKSKEVKNVIIIKGGENGDDRKVDPNLVAQIMANDNATFQ